MTESEIKNLALFGLGIENILDFESKNPLVLKVNQIYETAKRSLLSAYRWSFSVESIKIVGTKIKDSRYEYSFFLPEDFLRVEALFDSVKENQIYPDYIVRGDAIYTNIPTIYLRYIKCSCEEGYPDYFVECLKFKLAKDLCYNLTGDNNLKMYLDKQFLFHYMNAKNVDFRQYPTQIIKSRPYVYVRN